MIGILMSTMGWLEMMQGLRGNSPITRSIVQRSCINLHRSNIAFANYISPGRPNAERVSAGRPYGLQVMQIEHHKI